MGSDRYDADSVKAKYLAERDKRLVPGRSDIRDLATDTAFRDYTVDPFNPIEPRDPVVDDVDVVIAGGGIAGVVSGAHLRQAGIGRIRVLDKAGGFGGTWYWNRYPGVMCDVESYMYLPMLEELGYVPKHRYAFGEEIRLHLEAIGEKYDLADDALFHTAIERAEWDEDLGRWRIRTDRGDEIRAKYYVLGTGILSLLKLPAIEGMEDFAGASFHTARWDYGYTGGGPGQPLTNLGDKVVAMVGTGATGIQCLPALAEGAKHVYVFQRTPCAIGVRGNRPTDPDFEASLASGWQKARMDNFQTIMQGRPVDEDLVDDGWTHHYAAVHHPPRHKGMSIDDYLQGAEELDYGIMEEHRSRVAEIVHDPATAEALKPFYRYLCKRPCFHDEYLPTFNLPNVTLVDCPAGFDRFTAQGPVVDGKQYEVDLVVYGTGFEPELTPLPRRATQVIVGRGGLTLEQKWKDGSSTLFGLLSRGFPNFFIMPSPAQQAVVTANYTQLAVLGSEFVAGVVATLEKRGVDVFDVSPEAEADWVQQIEGFFVDGSRVMSACTPSRINNEGHPELMNPRNGNYGRGMGDYFAYRELLESWLSTGECEGLELEER